MIVLTADRVARRISFHHGGPPIGAGDSHRVREVSVVLITSASAGASGATRPREVEADTGGCRP